MRFLPSLRIVLILGLLICLAWQKVQPSVWLQRAYGQWMIQNDTIPEYEPFSSYAVQLPDEGEQPDLEHRFKAMDTLTQKTLAWLTQGLGHSMADWAKIASRLALYQYGLGVLAFFFLMGACSTVSGSPWLGTIFATLAFVPILLTGYPQDAQLVGFMLFTLFLNFLGSERVSWLAGIFVPGLWLFWVNSDGGFLAGAGLMFSLLLGRILDAYRLFRHGNYQRRDLFLVIRNIGLTLWVLLISGVLTQYNPNGYQVVKMALYYPRGDNMPDLPFWQPLEFSQLNWHCWFMMGYTAVIILLQLLSRRELSPKYLVLVVIFLVWGLIHTKATLWFFVIAPWVGCYLFSGIRTDPQKLQVRFSWKSSGVILLLPVIALTTAPLIRVGLGFGSVYELLSPNTPVSVAAVLKEQPEYDEFPEFLSVISGYPNQTFVGEILASPPQADFLLAVLKAPTHVVIHSHAYTYETTTWNEYMTMRDLGSSWWDLIERYQISLVILSPQAPLAQKLAQEKNWHVLRNDPELFIAIRKKIPDTWQ